MLACHPAYWDIFFEILFHLEFAHICLLNKLYAFFNYQGNCGNHETRSVMEKMFFLEKIQQAKHFPKGTPDTL